MSILLLKKDLEIPMNQVVARYLDGSKVKGETNDFLPAKALFHITQSGLKPQEVKVSDLKGLYFVWDMNGDPKHRKINTFPEQGAAPGRKVKVTFRDGEVMAGTTQGYAPDRQGFFLIPADPLSNNERCFVVMAATQKVEFVP